MPHVSYRGLTGIRMQYLIVFLEGIITFISPCLLPMIPIYLTYFAGGGERKLNKTLQNSGFFVLGFTCIFVAMGVFAGTVGSALREYHKVLNVIFGIVIVLLGLSYMGVIHLRIFKGSKSRDSKEEMTPIRSFVFGIVFAVGWTPCVGTFLGSALILAGTQGTAARGALMLLLYSLGLGIPFLMSAVLIDQLKGTFKWIKQHYEIINKICGILLIAVGIMMATGLFDRMIAFLA